MDIPRKMKVVMFSVQSLMNFRYQYYSILKFDLNGLAAKIVGTICSLHFSRVRNVFNEKLFVLRKKLKRLLRQLIILRIIALVIAIHRSMKYPRMKRKPL